jgi:hypothetical protein
MVDYNKRAYEFIMRYISIYQRLQVWKRCEIMRLCLVNLTYWKFVLVENVHENKSKSN